MCYLASYLFTVGRVFLGFAKVWVLFGVGVGPLTAVEGIAKGFFIAEFCFISKVDIGVLFGVCACAVCSTCAGVR